MSSPCFFNEYCQRCTLKERIGKTYCNERISLFFQIGENGIQPEMRLHFLKTPFQGNDMKNVRECSTTRKERQYFWN